MKRLGLLLLVGFVMMIGRWIGADTPDLDV